jgi:hypothetical protein
MFEEYWNGINRVLLDCEDWMKMRVAGRRKSLDEGIIEATEWIEFLSDVAGFCW